MLSLDSTTRAAYEAETTSDARAAVVLAALTAPVSVKVYNGSDEVMGSGTMQTPWATRSGAVLTVGEVSSFSVSTSGTPGDGWYLQFESGTKYVRGTFGPGKDFTWSLSTWAAGQAGTIGTASLTATVPVSWTISEPYTLSNATLGATTTYNLSAYVDNAGATFGLVSQSKNGVPGSYGITLNTSTGVLTVPNTLTEDSYAVVVSLNGGSQRTFGFAVAASVFNAQSGYTVPETTFTDGATITIRKAAGGFGTGPTVVLYDDFAGGVVGADVGYGDATVGTYSSLGATGVPQYATGGRDGSTAMKVLTAGDTGFDQLTYLHSENFTEFFCSFVFIPNGYMGATSPGVLPSHSFWKQTWMFSDDLADAPGKTDCCWGTATPSGGILGNEGGALYLNNADSLIVARLDFYGPNVYQYYGKNNAGANGSGPYYAAFCSSKHYGEDSGTSDVPWKSSPGSYRRFLFPGWVNSDSRFDHTNAEWLYDDVYLAIGANCAKRVIITDAATMAASRQLYLGRPTAWADTEISVVLPRLASGQSWSGKYLWVATGTNTYSLVGSFA